MIRHLFTHNRQLSQPAPQFVHIAVLLIGFSSVTAQAQQKGFNYDESKVPKFELPDPLINAAGKPVDATQWKTSRRAEILNLFRTHVYGNPPAITSDLKFHEFSRTEVFDGAGIRRQVRISFTADPKAPGMDMLIYTPNNNGKPVAGFLGLNFRGNHTVDPDPKIRLSEQWVRKSAGVTKNQSTEKTRGVASNRWPARMIVERGYMLATIYYGDIDPDFDDGWKNGIHQLEQQPRDGASGGSIAGWSWGLSRALDYLETDALVDAKRVAVFGHSRLGKTSLWAGAEDERFAMVISNNSGCGGAALSRREFGETVKRINTTFPHWFCRNFRKYNTRVNDLPVDQHMLVALAAPRPVYIASAEGDRWADPHGEFLSGLNAEPVYKLLGQPGLGTTEMPAVNSPIGQTIGYHIRTGKHNVTDYDWQRYLDFADRHFAKK